MSDCEVNENARLPKLTTNGSGHSSDMLLRSYTQTHIMKSFVSKTNAHKCAAHLRS